MKVEERPVLSHKVGMSRKCLRNSMEVIMAELQELDGEWSGRGQVIWGLVVHTSSLAFTLNDEGVAETRRVLSWEVT